MLDRNKDSLVTDRVWWSLHLFDDHGDGGFVCYGDTIFARFLFRVVFLRRDDYHQHLNKFCEMICKVPQYALIIWPPIHFRFVNTVCEICVSSFHNVISHFSCKFFLKNKSTVGSHKFVRFFLFFFFIKMLE